jgi:hypothetical protein
MNVRLGWTVVGVLVCLPGVATAEEEPKQAESQKQADTKESPPALEQHRLTLGMSLPVGLAGGSNGGALGALSIPYATAGYETRMAGPAWFLVALRGGLDASGTEYDNYGSWLAGGTVGFRVEAPVHEYVEVGGYGRFGGSLGEDSYGASWQLFADAGAGLHFRPTRLFGVRLGVEVLEWGYAETHSSGPVYASLYAHLKASPSVDLTFSL